MNLSRINLNLLVALDVLLTERHVTRAGEKLAITQSAMSNTLKQLREVFQDELFVRGAASSMTPTPRALELIQPVKAALEKAQAVFTKPEPFNPANSQKTFTIGMSDYTEFLLLPSLIKAITKAAPNVDLIIKHLNYINTDTVAEMENDKLDLAIGIYPQIPALLLSEQLFTDEAVVVGCSKNPLMKQAISMKKYAQANHLLILFFETLAESYAEKVIKKLGYTRRGVVTVPRTLAALYALPDTQLIATVLERIVKKVGKDLKLGYQSVPFKYDPIIISQVWHPKNQHDPCHQWLRTIVYETAKTI